MIIMYVCAYATIIQIELYIGNTSISTYIHSTYKHS